MRSDAVETKPQLLSRERIILIGNPNVGKSVIFNYLTGKACHRLQLSGHDRRSDTGSPLGLREG